MGEEERNVAETRRRITLLAADADRHLQAHLAALPLEEVGVRLLGQAESGEHALEDCRRVHPDVLLAEIHLPGLDGLALAEALRKEQPGLRVIFLTAAQDFACARAAVQVGAAGYLLKPIREEELLYTLRRIAEEKQAIRAEEREGLPEQSTEVYHVLTEAETALHRLLHRNDTVKAVKEIETLLGKMPSRTQKKLMTLEILSLIGRVSAEKGCVLPPEKLLALHQSVMEAQDAQTLLDAAGEALSEWPEAERESSGSLAADAERIIGRKYMHSGLTVQAIAREMNLSPNYLSAAYRGATGVRLGEAICRMRMERAQALLRGTDLRLEEIARSVGFENARYFVTVYQKQTGEHPLDCRKREQK